MCADDDKWTNINEYKGNSINKENSIFITDNIDYLIFLCWMKMHALGLKTRNLMSKYQSFTNLWHAAKNGNVKLCTLSDTVSW